MSEIPKIAHISWKTKDIVDNQSPVILNGLRNLIDMNPDWTVEVSDDGEVDLYLKDQLQQADYDLIKDRKIVEKTDLWRLLKIYNEGGFYMDIDRYYNIPLVDVIGEAKCVLPTFFDIDFSQDIMLSAPKNPIFKAAIDLNIDRRREGWTNIHFLGASTFMHAITQVTFGKVVDRDPGEEAFNQMRTEIDKTSFLKTYRESPPNDTIVYRHDESTFKQGNGKGKEELYKEYGIVHWTE